MRKRLLAALLSITVVGILLLAALFTDIFYDNSVESAKNQLRVYMNFFDVSAPFTQESAETYAEKTGARVTFMQADGTVVADSFAPVQGETREDREEVRAAIAQGEGFAVRESDTVGENMIYYCVRIDGGGSVPAGSLVRVGITLNTGLSFFVDALPTIVWFLVLDILCCLIFAWLLTSAVLKPVEDLTKEFATASGKEVWTKYAELKPLAKLMNEMNADIGDKVARIKEDIRIEKLVLDSMEHGIAIFRTPSDVILINKTAARLLNYEENEPVPLFSEDQEVADVLASGESASLYRKIGEKDYNFRFTLGEPNVLLITDVTESMAAARSKNEFIANVTHEMNTPLTSIRGFAELLASGALEGERAQRAAQTILTQSERLQSLVASIINYSEIDSDDLPVYEVDASRIARETLAALTPEFREKKVVLLSEIKDGVLLMSRQERVTEIFGNIIRNAIRYNREGGSVSVLLTQEEFTVSDTGIGISEENLERIFDRFFTVDKSHNGKNGGFGLGLSVVKKLCRKQGWALTVESKEGAGSTFRIGFVPNEGDGAQK